MNILHLLANDGFICVNKHIIKQLGLEEAVMIGELASIYMYNETRETLEDGWFYATIQKIQENTGLSEYKQQQILGKLCSLGIIQQKLMGMPRKRYLLFNTEKLFELIAGKLPDIKFPKIHKQAAPLLKIQETTPDDSGDHSGILQELRPDDSGVIYNNTLYNNIDNNRDNNPSGYFSKPNITNMVSIGKIDKKSTPNLPRVAPPQVQASSRLPNKVKAKLLDFQPEAKKSLEDYCLFLVDSYNLPERSLLNRIDDVCRKARNVDIAIEAICNYNINGGYKTLYVPGNLSRIVSDSVAISEAASEDDFVRDADGNIEEIW